MLKSMPFVAELFGTCGAGTGQEEQGCQGFLVVRSRFSAVPGAGGAAPCCAGLCVC